MRTILEKNLQRHTLIMDQLVQNEWLTVSQLTQKTKLVDRTIRGDLRDMRNYLEPALILTDKRRGYRLFLPDDLPVAFVYQRILKQSAAFTYLEKILTERDLTVSKLAEENYLSDNTLRRELKRIDEELRKLKMGLQFLPLQIIGDEDTIIWSFHQFFLERYGSFEFATTPTEMRLVSDLLNAYFDQADWLKVDSRESFAYLNHLRLLTFMRLRRIQQDHYRPIQPGETAPIVFKIPQKLKMRLAGFYGFEWNDQIAEQVLFPFATKIFFYSYQEMIDAGYMENYLEAAEHFRQTLSATELHIPNFEELLVSVANYLHQIHGTTKILYSEREQFTKELRRVYPKFTETMLAAVKSLLEESDDSFHLPIDDSMIDETLFLILMIWPDWHQQLAQVQPVMVAALLFNTHYSHNLYLKDTLERHFGDKLKIVMIKENTIPDFLANSHRVDLLITNLAQLEGLRCPVITISSNPTARDFSKIQTIYQQKYH